MAKPSPRGSIEAPLLAWGDARQALRAYRRRLVTRASALVGLGGLLALTIVLPPAPRLVWNASASAPIGLYRIAPGAAIRRGDMVVARLPSSVRQLAAQRRYLPLGVLLVKQAGATKGSVVCAKGAVLQVDGQVVAKRRSADAWGYPLPSWQGCHRLGRGEVFLLMAGNRSSFDGRYFGVTTARDVVGKAQLVWAW